MVKNSILRLMRNVDSGLTIRHRKIKLKIGLGCWLMVPATLWVVAVIYVPIMGAALTGFQDWALAVAILVLMYLSLFLHSLAHLATAKACGSHSGLFLDFLGDPAHTWPAANDAGREALIAIAGPLMHGLLAVFFYFIWNLQINLFINVIAFFLTFFNLGLMAFNLIPVFPFDGGRLLRAIIWRILYRPALATRLAFRLGWVLSAGLIIWGIILFTQNARFSLDTGVATFIFVALMIISLSLQKGWHWDRPAAKVLSWSPPVKGLRIFLSVLLVLPLIAITISMVPMNDGLEAPGFTASVEPMIRMPSQYRHSTNGSLILTTVIPQAPILSGEWFYAHLDKSIKLEAEHQIVPANNTPQNVSLQNYQMLLDSKTTAVIVGLRLAGYTVNIKQEGVRITSIIDQSHAVGVLQPGDIITAIDGEAVKTPQELTHQLGLLTAGSVLDLTIERNGHTMDVSVPSLQPLQPGGPVRIGISIVPYNTGYNLPFPVDIVPEKVNGGPSAGLMFTLGVYDLVTGHDITGGRTIAGTGTIDLEGNVGTIGGVQQKVVAAERAGAQYFLCPPDNYQDALNMATSIKVVKVATAQDAINFLSSLSPLKSA